MAAKLVCCIPGCGNPIYVKKRMLCSAHYSRFKTYGDPTRGALVGPEAAVNCIVDGCAQAAISHSGGLCRAHYLRKHRHGSPTGGGERRVTEIGAPLEWMRAHLNYDGGECLIFPYGKHSAGYGALVDGGKRYLAHRWVCEKIYGPSPAGKTEAAHSCGNGHLGCVNPKHLRWATHLENVDDRDDHGRTKRGDENANSRLSEDNVTDIFALKSSAEHYQDIADRFGVSSGTIHDIWAGRSWAWLTGMNGGVNITTKKAKRPEDA